MQSRHIHRQRETGRRKTQGWGIRSANVEMINRGQLGTLATYGGARRRIIIEEFISRRRNYCRHYADERTRVLTGPQVSRGRTSHHGHNSHSSKASRPIALARRTSLLYAWLTLVTLNESFVWEHQREYFLIPSPEIGSQAALSTADLRFRRDLLLDPACFSWFLS